MEQMKRKKSRKKARLHNRIHASAISFPHGAKPWLTANVPDFDLYIAFSYFPHVETNGRYHIFSKLTRLKTSIRSPSYPSNADVIESSVSNNSPQ
jgi:hypothetical protein